jgi:hypothetical protein
VECVCGGVGLLSPHVGAEDQEGLKIVALAWHEPGEMRWYHVHVPANWLCMCRRAMIISLARRRTQRW